MLSPELAAGISRVKGVKQLGFRSGNWLSADESSEVLQRAYGDSLRAKRDYAMLAMLFGCGFRRSELVGLELEEIQMRQGHWVVVDLIGKGGHIRTVPIPEWVKAALDQWTLAAKVTDGRIFRAVARTDKVWGKGISQNVVWYVVKICCQRAGLEHIAPHDLYSKLFRDQAAFWIGRNVLPGLIVAWTVTMVQRIEDAQPRLPRSIQDLQHIRDAFVCFCNTLYATPYLASLGNEIIVRIDHKKSSDLLLIGRLWHAASNLNS